MMKDYHELNLKFDVLLLAYVFKKFGNNSLKNYGLCPSHYFSAPAVCCDAMLNMTKIELELISYSYICTYFLKSYGRRSFLTDIAIEFPMDLAKPTISI